MSYEDLIARLRDPVARNAWGNADMFHDAAYAIATLQAELVVAREVAEYLISVVGHLKVRVKELEDSLQKAKEDILWYEETHSRK